MLLIVLEILNVIYIIHSYVNLYTEIEIDR